MFSKPIACLFALAFLFSFPSEADHHDEINTNGATQQKSGKSTIKPNPSGSDLIGPGKYKMIPKEKRVPKKGSKAKKEKKFEKAKDLKMEAEPSKKDHLHL